MRKADLLRKVKVAVAGSLAHKKAIRWRHLFVVECDVYNPRLQSSKYVVMFHSYRYTQTIVNDSHIILNHDVFIQSKF